MSAHHPIGEPAELAALYAVGAFTPAETTAFEEHLATGCERCEAELRALDPLVAALYATIGPVPPAPERRSELLARVAAGDAEPPDVASGALPPLPDPQVWREWGGDDLALDVVIPQAATAGWEPTGIDGVEVRRLFVDRANDRMTALVRMAPGTAYPQHVHNGPEECLVLDGDLHAGHHAFRAGDYQRMAPGSHHGIQSTEGGCLLLIVSSLSDEID
jgi:anti-sigma factor ChrR (cupin superfamily)